jgi:hypothetical protein
MPLEIQVDQGADAARQSEHESKLAKQLAGLNQRMTSYRREVEELQRILSNPCDRRIDRQLRLNDLRDSLIPLLQISIDSLQAFLSGGVR